MVKLFVGIVLGLLIGMACRWFDIPVPSPRKLAGAMLVVAMTVGYMVTDRIIANKLSGKGPASTQEMCGGPTGAITKTWNGGEYEARLSRCATG